MQKIDQTPTFCYLLQTTESCVKNPHLIRPFTWWANTIFWAHNTKFKPLRLYHCLCARWKLPKFSGQSAIPDSFRKNAIFHLIRFCGKKVMFSISTHLPCFRVAKIWCLIIIFQHSLHCHCCSCNKQSRWPLAHSLLTTRITIAWWWLHNRRQYHDHNDNHTSQQQDQQRHHNDNYSTTWWKQQPQKDDIRLEK